jgi:hypothetical protein
MSKNKVTFARNLVKGKIAETIFAQMLREANAFTVLEFGYEKIIPELVQQGFDYGDKHGIIETLRTAPDFAVINNETKSVKLIEVKYMRRLSEKYALADAERMKQTWNPSYLFIATLDGFYFDSIDDVVINEGVVSELEHPSIPPEMQSRYLQILIDFEKDN